MNTTVVAVFVLLGLAAQATCQVTPPNPVAIVTNLIKAYAKYESGRDNTEIDMQGSTDWYKKYFITYTPLKLDYYLTPPNIISSSRDSKAARLSTLMCPWTNFNYDCQLDTAMIRGSASATTKSTQWNVGGTTKHTWMYGVQFLGTGGKIGPVAQFSFNWAGKDDETSATTDQSTTTGTTRLTVAPGGNKCYELKSSMNRYTQRGESKMQAVFTEWVGFHDHPSVNWKDDNSGAHYYRLRNIWDIVKTAKAANLPEAAGWDFTYSNGAYKATYDNTFQFDFFLGTDGANKQVGYDKESTECIDNMPKDWNTWLPANSPQSGRNLLSALTEPSHAAPQKAPMLVMKLLPETARTVPTQDGSSSDNITFKPMLPLGFDNEQESTTRKLLQDPSSVEATSNKKAAVTKCPVEVHVTDAGTKAVRDTECFGKGLQAYQRDVSRATRTEQVEDQQCAVTVVLPGSPGYNKNGLSKVPYGMQGKFKWDVEAKGKACQFKATSRQELDARDAAKKAKLATAAAGGGVRPAVGEPDDFISKLKKLTKTLCYYESGADCDVDTDGNTDWYKRYFASLPAINGVVGADDITMSPATSFSAVSSSFFCQYNPSTNIICQASSADMSSSATTKSHTSTWNFQWKVGFKLKAQASFLGIGPSAEYETENTVDWGYSFSNGESKTETDGTSTTATVRLPMTPDMNKCTKISIITRKASAKGASRAWVCADGWVGMHQDPNYNWKDVDAPGEKHYYRAWHIAKIISTAQKYNLNAGGAFDWYIDGQGRGCVANAVDFDVQQGVMSYVYPELFDKDSAECAAGQAATASHPAAITPASTTGTPDWLVVEAAPLDGEQDVETPCASFDDCGM